MPKNNITYYEIAGKGQPLLFIHGLGSSTRDWEEQVPFFSKKYRVITLDLRGHGKSDKPKDQYTMSLFANDAADLLKSLELGPTHIVGLSLGGAVAFEFAIKYPDLTKTMTIVNSGPGISMDTFKMKFEFFKRTFIVKLVGMKKMGQVLSTKIFIKPEQEELREKLISRWAENDKKAYLNAFNSFKGWDVNDLLHTIKCPTLIMGSDEDYSPSSLKIEYTKLIPGAKFVEFKDARHALPLEKPDEFNSVLMEFLSNNP